MLGPAEIHIKTLFQKQTITTSKTPRNGPPPQIHQGHVKISNQLSAKTHLGTAGKLMLWVTPMMALSDPLCAVWVLT